MPQAKLRVIPHPVFRSDPVRDDDGRTVLALGVIRPYKGLPDAVEAVLGVPGARLLVAGDPRIPLDALRAAAGDRAEWRLGYLGRGRDRARARRRHVAVFPYRAELDQSGALLQALGAGVPAVVYDVGGLGEIVGAFGAGRVVAGRRRRGAAATRSGAARRRRRARRGTRRRGAGARRDLTWDSAAAAHLTLYEELV